MPRSLAVILSLAAPLAPGGAVAGRPPAAPVEFARDVKPVLASRCFACHGPAAQKSGLRLDIKRRAMDGGDNGPAIVPGKSAESDLIRRVTAADPKKQMPPGKPLTSVQVGVLRAWIDQGAPWPETRAEQEAPKSRHWSFQPVLAPPVPKVKNAAWVRNPIDAFILARLEAKGLKPSPEADPATLIRRVSLDLTGIPPAPEEVSAFVRECGGVISHRPSVISPARPNPETASLSGASAAYDRLVDRLLASPHFGERWARHWLDLARYADSNGYTIDSARSIWPYRDWVVNALNRNLPFDEFTIQQLAGDMLPNATLEQKIATGFHRNTLVNEEGGTDKEQFRVEAVVDRVNTTGAVWLGLTVGCAQCHSHKYDPISQKEYYELFAFFNNQDEPTLSLGSPEQAHQQEEVKKDLAAAGKALAEYDAARRESAAARREDPERRPLAARVTELTEKSRELARTLPTTLALDELKQPRQSFVHLRGDFLRHGQPVRPDVPSVLPPLPEGITKPTRLDLARWLVDPKNPLTARVQVNRVWQDLFGAGLVETENDFGTQGTPPTHPKLLDWLAARFAKGSGFGVQSSGHEPVGPPTARHSPSPSGPRPPTPDPWDLKALIRLVVTSAAYRQSSRARRGLAEADPQNKLLGRQNRVRLEAEIVRDSALAASGLLCPKIGGPSVFPPQPAGLELFTQSKKNWKASEGEDRYRRGMYTFLWRSAPYAMFTAFDAPNAQVTCTRRARSNTPLQALMVANDQAFLEMAQALAARTLRASLPDEERVRWAFRRCLCREPSARESRRLLDYCRSQRSAFESAPKDAEALAPGDRPAGVSAAEAAAWTSVARVLLNLDEFITRE